MTLTDNWPKVSVVIPARNAESTIGETIDGVLAQKYPGELEIVVGRRLGLRPYLQCTSQTLYPSVVVVPNPRPCTTSCGFESCNRGQQRRDNSSLRRPCCLLPGLPEEGRRDYTTHRIRRGRRTPGAGWQIAIPKGRGHGHDLHPGRRQLVSQDRRPGWTHRHGLSGGVST